MFFSNRWEKLVVCQTNLKSVLLSINVNVWGSSRGSQEGDRLHGRSKSMVTALKLEIESIGGWIPNVLAPQCSCTSETQAFKTGSLPIGPIMVIQHIESTDRYLLSESWINDYSVHHHVRTSSQMISTLGTLP